MNRPHGNLPSLAGSREKPRQGEKHEAALGDAAARRGAGRWWFTQNHFLGRSPKTPRLRGGDWVPFPDRRVPPRHPWSIPPERPFTLARGLLLQKISFLNLLNHFQAMWLVGPGAPARRAAGGATSATAEVGKVGHGAVMAPAWAGWAPREPTPAAPVAPLPSPHRSQSSKICQPGPRKPTCLLTRC